MEVLVVVGGNGERLLDQTIRLVSIPIGSTAIRVGILLSGAAIALSILVEAVASSLALHLAVGEKAARNPACAPGFAIGPSSHPGLSLIPDEDGSRFDRLSFLFGESALDAWEQSDATCFEQNDRVGGRAHVPIVRLHAVRWRTYQPRGLQSLRAFGQRVRNLDEKEKGTVR